MMDPLETEITKYQQRKDQLCEILMDKETEFAEYIHHLHAFESKFLHHLAPFHHQIHRWEQRCIITEAIIQKLEKIDWSNQEPPTETHHWLQDIEIAAQREELAALNKPAPKELNPEEQLVAKDIYKKLARRFHPDLVDVEEVQQRRQEVMSEINDAYRSGDIEALRELEYHPDIRLIEEENQGEKWERLVREIALLQRKIVDCKQMHTEAQESELAVLMTRSEQEKDPFKHLETLLKKKITRLQERWLRLRNREEKCWLGLDGL